MKKEFKGTDGTVGFAYEWNGNKEAGEGKQEVKAITEGKNIEIEFVLIDLILKREKLSPRIL